MISCANGGGNADTFHDVVEIVKRYSTPDNRYEVGFRGDTRPAFLKLEQVVSFSISKTCGVLVLFRIFISESLFWWRILPWAELFPHYSAY